jgi:sterol desaturase/sphingolipid hydroxylase (fatty acid hydroxylase superfamily)
MATSLADQLVDPTMYAVPFFAAFIVLEALSLRHELAEGAAETRTKRGYQPADARTNLSMGVISIGFSLAFKLLTLSLFVFLWAVAAPWHIPTDPWWYWPLLMLVVDFAWYLNHRFSHRVRIGWAAHQAHHSSEYFNFSTALRQKWNPWSEAIFWLPLPLLGFAPWTIYVAFAVNLIFQFFLHTETVDKLPRPIELVFNTPSHHRVHHGSDPEYLDRNYAGILIIWDRMFGSFQPELHRPTYGLTTPVNTYNLVKLQYGEYGKMITDVRGATRLRDKLGHVFAPPGWKPTGEAP